LQRPGLILLAMASTVFACDPDSWVDCGFQAPCSFDGICTQDGCMCDPCYTGETCEIYDATFCDRPRPPQNPDCESPPRNPINDDDLTFGASLFALFASCCFCIPCIGLAMCGCCAVYLLQNNQRPPAVRPAAGGTSPYSAPGQPQQQTQMQQMQQPMQQPTQPGGMPLVAGGQFTGAPLQPPSPGGGFASPPQPGMPQMMQQPMPQPGMPQMMQQPMQQPGMPQMMSPPGAPGGSRTFQVTVPANAFPGQQLMAMTPEGQNVMVAVPPGMVAGQVFTAGY